MTKDVIALTPRMPDPLTVLAGLLAGGPDKLVGTTGEDAVVQLCDEQGRPLVSIEAPLLVQVAGEAERLLGATAPPVPFWWTEARATTGVEEAELLAGTFAARIATLAGGSAWPPQAARSLSVVKSEGVSVAPTPAAAQPAVDALTDKVAVVIQDRPVVAMTAWLSDAFRAAADAELGLQIVTSPGATLSPAVRNSLSGWPSRWVVQDERDGYYDGLSGAVLRWQHGLFATVESADATPEDPHTPVAAAYQEVTDTDDRQLAISFRTVHPADDRLVLGGALESVWQELTGQPPAGWGTAEPANLPWSLRRLTDVAFERAPAPTWLVVVGSPDRPGLATVRVSRTKAGVEEDVTLAFGYGPGEEPRWTPCPGWRRCSPPVTISSRCWSSSARPAATWRCRRASRGPAFRWRSCSARRRCVGCPATGPGAPRSPSLRSSSARGPVRRCTTRCPATRRTCPAGRTSSG